MALEPSFIESSPLSSLTAFAPSEAAKHTERSIIGNMNTLREGGQLYPNGVRYRARTRTKIKAETPSPEPRAPRVEPSFVDP